MSIRKNRLPKAYRVATLVLLIFSRDATADMRSIDHCQISVESDLATKVVDFLRKNDGESHKKRMCDKRDLYHFANKNLDNNYKRESVSDSQFRDASREFNISIELSLGREITTKLDRGEIKENKNQELTLPTVRGYKNTTSN